MKEYFENAYEGLENTIVSFVEGLGNVSEMFLVVLVYMTVPFWWLPYHFWKKIKKDGESDV